MAHTLASTGTATPTPTTHSDTLTIRLYPDQGWAYYEGSAAQLQAEGLLPPDLQWPRSFARVHWESGVNRFELTRCRPDGAKGPRSNFYNCDHWQLSVTIIDGCGPHWRQRVIDKQVQALARVIHEQTSTGQRQSEQRWAAFARARDDAAFGRFLSTATALVPAPKRRGRSAKATPVTKIIPTQGANHV